MQRIFVLVAFILAGSVAVLCQGPIAPPDMQLWVFKLASESTIDVFDSYNTVMDTVITNCALDGPYFDAAVAGDGNIWFTVNSAGLQAYDPATRNCTAFVSLGSFSSAGQIVPSLGGKYLYFLGNGQIWRMNLITYEMNMVLQPPSDNLVFSGFGFQNNKMYTSLQYLVVETDPQILSSYDYDIVNDEPVVPALTEDAWAPRDGFLDAFVKFKKCPRSSEYFCALTTVSGGQWVWSSLVNGTDGWVVIDTYVPAFYGAYFRDYFTAPWGFMYATDENGGLYIYDWTSPSIPTSLFPNVIEESTLYGTFVALIGAPYMQINDYGGVCYADVYFNSYSWTTKYSIEVKNSVTGLFEDFYVMPDYVSSDVESRYVNMEVICDAPTKTYRIRFEGDTNMSDNVYSVPITVPCSCVSVPIAANVEANIVPILECIEKIDDANFVVHLGYENVEEFPAYIPIGDTNKFSDFSDRGQPTVFRTGRTNFYPTSAFSFVTVDTSISWYLSYYQLPIDTQNTAVYCPSSLRVSLQFFYSIIDPNEENIEKVRVAMAEYLKISESRVTVVGFQVTPVTKRSGLASGNNVDLEAEIKEASPEQQEPSSSDSVKELVQVAKNQTNGDKIIDPNSVDPDSEILGVKPLPTGVEQGGNAQPGARDPNSPGSKTSGVNAASASFYSLVSLGLGSAVFYFWS